MSERTTGSEQAEADIEPAKDAEVPHLEDGAAPDTKHDVGQSGAEEQIRGEWQRAGEMQQESDHLREVLDEARNAVQKASDADSMASGGMGVQPEDVQDEGSGHADEEERTNEGERSRS